MTSHTALLDRVRKLLAKAEAEGLSRPLKLKLSIGDLGRQAYEC
jgi:hypothetical protein